MDELEAAEPTDARPSAAPPSEERRRPTQDELLDEALEETFPASDPVSVYRLC
jgi:hypothetical protein